MPLPNNQILNAEVIIYGSIASAGSNQRNTVNVFHYQTTPTSLTKSHVAVANAVQNEIMTPLQLALNARWIETHITCRFIDDAQDAPVTVTATSPGGVVGDSMPMINTVFLLLRTGLRGKSYRGSKKFGPISETDTTSGTDDILNAAALTRWGNVLTAVLANVTDVNGVVWTPTVLSRKLSQLKVNPTTVVANAITQGLLKKSIGRLRKREAHSVY